MRDYAKVAPQFWTGRTGKALKAAGPEAVIVAMYLMTSPHANMIGVYHCPVAYISIDTGLTLEGASKGLASAIEADFCTFDESCDYVFVHQFAEYQIGPELAATDNRVKGVVNELAKVPKGQCWQGFRARYTHPYNLPLPASVAPKAEAPSKPLQSQEQEQKKEQKQEKEQDEEKPADAGPKVHDLTAKDLIAEGVDANAARDWLRIRKAKKAPLTPTAWDAVKREAVLLGMSPAEAVKHAAENNWQGFRADWVLKARGGGGKAPPASKHAGFAEKNYREGVTEDGSLV